MKRKKIIHPQIDQAKIDDLVEVAQKIAQLPRDKLMYVAGAVAALSADIPVTSSGCLTQANP